MGTIWSSLSSQPIFTEGYRHLLHPRAHSWADDSGQGSAAALFSSWVEMETQGKPVKSWHQNLSNLDQDVYSTERLKSCKVILSKDNYNLWEQGKHLDK